MAEPEHEHGKMDTTEQEKTFAGFVTFTKWAVIVIIAILVFLALFRT
ncbi:aa3-type cytochrome c oxidase subunit IV [Jannaschia sp. LMIT008]|nr:aa3-type cytochrome c oxidase subunit IV [Jannaschia sp. LMIT008]